jgi:maleylpyruvate isomerase
MKPVLYNQCRSGPSYRVRIALNLKGVAFDYVAIDLAGGEQRGPAYTDLNPQGLVPSLKIDGALLTQSGAILEYLEERFPAPPLLPAGATDRALVRGMAAVIGSDIQPLNNLRIQAHLKSSGADEKALSAWTSRWIAEGFSALEALVARHGGAFCFGDSVTLADLYLVPQVTTALRLNVDVVRYTRLWDVFQRAGELPAFAAARPNLQPDWR